MSLFPKKVEYPFKEIYELSGLMSYYNRTEIVGFKRIEWIKHWLAIGMRMMVRH